MTEDYELSQLRYRLTNLEMDLEKIKKQLEEWREEIEETPCPVDCCEACEDREDCVHNLTKAKP